MAFSDIKFIFIFFPVFIIAYGLIQDRFKGALLLAGSLVFYYTGAGIAGTVIFAAVTAADYFLARLIGKSRNGWKKAWLIIALTLTLVLLVYFKYIGFFLSVFNIEMPEISGTGATVSLLGVGFFTLQIISYIVDVYRGKVTYETDFIAYANGIAAFPKLISGPFTRYGDMGPQLKSLKTRREDLEHGMVTFVLGLGMKVLLADSLSAAWGTVQRIGYENISTPLAWIGMISYSLQLYLDFNGYSLMAVGIGEMLGLKLPENFRHPYTSGSVSEFWRRWHITLGAWFKDYIYIPLGGSRNGKLRMILSLLAVWLATGLWHGAGWNFILWGMMHFVFIAAEKFFLDKHLKKHKVISHIYLCFVVAQLWILFAVPDLKDIGSYFTRLYPFLSSEQPMVYEMDFLETVKTLWPVYAVSIFCCLPFAGRFFRKYNGRVWIVAIEFVIFWLSVYMIVKRGSGAFMYFAF